MANNKTVASAWTRCECRIAITFVFPAAVGVTVPLAGGSITFTLLASLFAVVVMFPLVYGIGWFLDSLKHDLPPPRLVRRHPRLVRLTAMAMSAVFGAGVFASGGGYFIATGLLVMPTALLLTSFLISRRPWEKW